MEVQRVDAVARGVVLTVTISMLPGRAIGVVMDSRVAHVGSYILG